MNVSKLAIVGLFMFLSLQNLVAAPADNVQTWDSIFVKGKRSIVTNVICGARYDEPAKARKCFLFSYPWGLNEAKRLSLGDQVIDQSGNIVGKVARIHDHYPIAVAVPIDPSNPGYMAGFHYENRYNGDPNSQPFSSARPLTGERAFFRNASGEQFNVAVEKRDVFVSMIYGLSYNNMHTFKLDMPVAIDEAVGAPLINNRRLFGFVIGTQDNDISTIAVIPALYTITSDLHVFF